MRIHLHRPVITASDRAAVDALLTDPHSGASVVRDLEAALADLTGYKFAVSCASATAGLMAALEACVRAPGVAAPALTFAATWNAIRRSNNKPVLVDVTPETWTLDLARVPTQAPRVAVELLGAECLDADVIDSACSLRRGMAAGQKCKAAVVSFNTSKTITGLGGGAILTNDLNLAALARQLLDQGKADGDATKPAIFGFNGRIGYMSAALVLSQLQRFDAIAAHKAQLYAVYREHVREASWQTGVIAPWLASPMLRSGREVGLALDRLKLAGIEARQMYQLPDKIPVERAPVAHKIARRAIQLPMGLDMTPDDVREVCELVNA